MKKQFYAGIGTVEKPYAHILSLMSSNGCVIYGSFATKNLISTA